MTSTSPALTPRFRRAISRPVTLITPGLFRSLEATPAWDNAPAHAAMSVAIPIGRNNILPTPSSCGTEPTLYRRLAPAFLARQLAAWQRMLRSLDHVVAERPDQVG